MDHTFVVIRPFKAASYRAPGVLKNFRLGARLELSRQEGSKTVFVRALKPADAERHRREEYIVDAITFSRAVRSQDMNRDKKTSVRRQ